MRRTGRNTLTHSSSWVDGDDYHYKMTVEEAAEKNVYYPICADGGEDVNPIRIEPTETQPGLWFCRVCGSITDRCRVSSTDTVYLTTPSDSFNINNWIIIYGEGFNFDMPSGYSENIEPKAEVIFFRGISNVRSILRGKMDISPIRKVSKNKFCVPPKYKSGLVNAAKDAGLKVAILTEKGQTPKYETIFYPSYVYNSGNGVEYDKINELDKMREEAGWQRPYSEFGGCPVLLHKTNDIVKGYLAWQFKPRDDLGSIPEIGQIYVKEKFRGNGIGTEMVNIWLKEIIPNEVEIFIPFITEDGKALIESYIEKDWTEDRTFLYSGMDEDNIPEGIHEI